MTLSVIRLKLSSTGTTHRLELEHSVLEDSGTYVLKTNREESRSVVKVKEFPYLFANGLPSSTTVHEGSMVSFDVECEDEDAQVDWYSGETRLNPEHSR